jgi:hypothetical protein
MIHISTTPPLHTHAKQHRRPPLDNPASKRVFRTHTSSTQPRHDCTGSRVNSPCWSRRLQDRYLRSSTRACIDCVEPAGQDWQADACRQRTCS